MALGNEHEAVQRALVRYAVEAGWTELAPDEALRYRANGILSPLLDSVFIEQVQRLNPGVVDYRRAEDIAKRLVRVRPSIEGNLDAWQYLKGLKTVFVEEQKRERNVRLLDLVNIDANKFHVTAEFTFSNGVKPDVRADVVFFINGVPVLVAETKAATAMNGISEALGDIQYYHGKAPELLALNQVFVITQLIEFYYGATWNPSAKNLNNWRDEQAGDFETLCKTFFAPRRMMRALTDYVLFTRKNDELSKIVLRPHQMRAVERCIGRAADPDKHSGLVWHTQGSGKTYTMIVTAKMLLENPAFENPTVIMIVDRNELESQLFGNLESVGFGNVKVASSKENLRSLLAEDRRGLIVSMIHKFDEMPAEVSTRSNIFVLIDEAHRTTGGDLGNYLWGAFPNATFIGFTGTPIDKTAKGKGTFKIFGKEDRQGYLDKYSIKESIQDGATVPLHYSLAPNELKVDRDTLEREFLALAEAEGMSDIDELNAILDKAVSLKNMLKEPDRINKVAAFVAQHYTENVEPMGYKAFLVAVDREACCLYKQALDRHLPPEYSRVVISPSIKKDPMFMQRHYLSTDEEKAVRRTFTKPDELPKILIVTEKLLTGFDAPILYCMYLDKPMRDHVLLQAIARVNRPYEDADGRRKPSGFVLDFVGIFDNLEKALAFDSQDVSGVIEGIDVLREDFAHRMESAKENYLAIGEGKTGDKEVEAVLDHFRDKERRQEFYKFFSELQDVYEILSPDAFLRPFLKDYQRLSAMFFLLKAAYDRRSPVDKEFKSKTTELVQEHTQSGIIQSPTDAQPITPDLLEAVAGSDRPDTVKVFNLLKVLTEMIDKRGAVQPYLISIGERAQRIAEAFEDRQMTTKQALEELDAISNKIKRADAERTTMGLSERAFAVYFMLQQEEGFDEPYEVAEKIDVAFERYPYWHISEKQERSVRIEIYKALGGLGVHPNRFPAIASRVLNLIRRATT